MYIDDLDLQRMKQQEAFRSRLAAGIMFLGGTCVLTICLLLWV